MGGGDGEPANHEPDQLGGGGRGGDAVVAELAAELVAAPLDLAQLAALVAIALPGGRPARRDVAAPLDLDVLAALVAIALVAAVVAELEPQHARHRRAQLGRGERKWWCAGAAPLVAIALVAAVVAELAAELVAAPLDLDVLAALVAIALVAAVVAELEPPHARHRRAQLGVVCRRSWWPRRSTSTCSPIAGHVPLGGMGPSDGAPVTGQERRGFALDNDFAYLG